MSSAEQRAELQSQIWKIANEVRGSVDGWDFKQYVLGTLFYRFISENFSDYMEGGDDSINYAANAGKSGGEFFTPQCVSKLIAKLATHGQTSINKIYDPAAGSGSLLLQAKKQFDEHMIEDGFFGQEINHTTYNLARMNMFLHNVKIEKYHFTLLRNLYEKAANFLGYGQWSDLLPDDKELYAARVMNFYSHRTLLNEEVAQPTEAEKQIVKVLFNHLIDNAKFWKESD